MYYCSVLCIRIELKNSQRKYIRILPLLAEFMRELSTIDFYCDAIIMKQDVLLCLIGFWHLCHT